MDPVHDPDILMLSDSFGFGWGVNRNDCLEKLLEDACGKTVLNMSVPGYGMLQEEALLRRWSKGHAIKGKTVIFLFYPNDVIESQRTPTREELKDIFDMQRTSSYRGIYSSSYLAYVVKKSIHNIKDIIKGKRRAGARANPTEEVKSDFNNFKSIIGRIKELAQREDLKVLFVWIPSVNYYEKNDAEYGGLSENEVFAGVKRILDKASIPMLDLRPALERSDYYLLDGHWNPFGHYKAALAIKRFFETN